MATKKLQVALPEAVWYEIKAKAASNHRSVSAELVAWAQGIVPSDVTVVSAKPSAMRQVTEQQETDEEHMDQCQDSKCKRCRQIRRALNEANNL